ncbi:MAG: alpha/beta fold hydrolase [Dactylosporangium sp.]|nr:alpha/beta hydrolase [Dactylosporangium sp.]NNJ61105.1 alpha/beta fold hydrolase [Dactylosporangium sp.]
MRIYGLIRGRDPHPTRRISAALLAATVGFGGLVALPATQAAATRPAESQVAWGDCPPVAAGIERDPRQQCAVLTVPLNYRKPHGRTIDLAISRIATAEPGKRRGILLSNPGGPGGSGLDLPGMLARMLPAEVLDTYDLIGFDPRGIGHSTPVTCGIDQAEAMDLILPYPATDGSIDANVAFARQTAQDCADLSGDLLPYLSTRNTARDMDRIRQALGERKLSYLGFSYGTYLGTVYTSLFKHNADRIVLDSAIDPNKIWYDLWRTWGEAVAIRFPDAAAVAVRYSDIIGFGTSVAEVTANYHALLAALDRQPVVIQGITVTGNTVREITRSYLYEDYVLPELVSIWRQVADLVAGDADPAATARGSQAASLAGTLRDWQRSRLPLAAADVPVDNGTAALYAVVCADVTWPRDIDRYRRNVAADRRAWPLTAGMPANIWPCGAWKYQALEAPVTVTSHGRRNILILQNRRDPATSWRSAMGLRVALGRRAAFVGVDQGGHVALGRGTCADTITFAFLATGVLPGRDIECPGPAQGTAPPVTMVRSVAGPL